MTQLQIPGIHHVTAIAGDAQQNVDFYAGFLGLRLVKKTVNFDDPTTYHLYFGDDTGRPGTILTFFPWAGSLPGKRGTGQATVISFSVPTSALDYWMNRFADHGLDFETPYQRFGDTVLAFLDPDGIQLELVAHADAETARPWQSGLIPDGHAICGFHSVTLSVTHHERTAALLTTAFGFRLVRQEDGRFRFQAPSSGAGTVVDLLHQPDVLRGRMGTGIVHHVAWRTPTDEAQLQWHEKLKDEGYNVTSVMDRQYFHSIYFREPGGILFEIATDPPGFTLDETPEALGSALKLPPWLEPKRAFIEHALPALRPSRRPAS